MAPPRKRKNTVRQRRKQAARETPAVENLDVEDVQEEPQATAKQADRKTGRKVKKPVPQETWPRRGLAVLIGLAVVLQCAFSAPLAFYDWQTFVFNFLSLNPFLLAPAVWVAMLLVYKRLGLRRMRFLEAMVMAMMMFFVANTAGSYFVGGLSPSSSTPATSPTPAVHATATPKETPAAVANSTGTKPSPSAKPCPVDSKTCAQKTSTPAAVPLQEEAAAVALAMLLAIATTIWGFPTLYRWMWGPRKPRTTSAKGKK